MPLPGETRSSAVRDDSDQALPLFRPEALAAQQQKFYGEVILIRPLSLMLLGWFALGLTGAILGFLLLGRFTERGHVSGVVISTRTAGQPSTAPALEAELYVPGRWIRLVRPGSEIALHCDACSGQYARPSATVLAISDAPLGPAEQSQSAPNLAGPVYKIAVSLPPLSAQLEQLNSSPQTGTRVEAEIPLGRKPLIKWFFERSGS
jgi:hypothetical protein